MPILKRKGLDRERLKERARVATNLDNWVRVRLAIEDARGCWNPMLLQLLSKALAARQQTFVY